MLTNQEINLIDQLKNTYLFSDLSESELMFLNNNSIEVRYLKGELIYKEGSYSNNALYLLNGYVKIFVEKNRRVRIVKIIKPNWFIGLLSIFSYETHQFSAKSIDNVTIRSIDNTILKQLLDENKLFNYKFIHEISLLSTSLTKFLVLQNQKNVRGRIADILLHLSDNIYFAKEFDMVFTRKELAELANTSTETAIRMLNDLRNEEVISINSKSITIQDIDQLKKISSLG
jgi:CRP/FNR family transcriptional regulator